MTEMGPQGAALAGFHDLEPEREDFEKTVIEGLGRTPKTLPCKFFYDQEGSRLFEAICELDEYYPTRTEIAILRDNAPEMAELMGKACHLIAFGSGASVKIRILLEALDSPAACTAIDISREHLLDSLGALAAEFPDIETVAVCADYTAPFDIPAPARHPDARRIGFFPGSTIGNFTPDEATGFLRTAAAMLKGGDFLIGVDLKKDEAVLNAAYNDAKGVTAAFNLNLLARINRELGGDFEVASFAHKAFFNAKAGRIEMHLESLCNQSASVGGLRFHFEKGETVHTENSYKYAIDEFRALAGKAGYIPAHVWTDPENLFAIHYLRLAS